MTKKDSVAKGGGAVAIARMLGMVLSFLLFLILARHSAEEAGVFRAVLTYLIMGEFLGLLGMHRWLSTEIAQKNQQPWQLFLATNAVMVVVAVVLMLIYWIIAYSNIYTPDINLGLKLATLSLIPSGIYQCVQSALVGIGKTKTVGHYNAFEYVLRCTVSIALVYFGFHITYVILVFVCSRWIIGLYGFVQLSRHLYADSWQPSKQKMAEVIKSSPKFLIIIGAFLLLRNSALVMIPAIIGEKETAVFGVAYQLFDMILIIPSVLAITSNHVFVNKASQSQVALKRVSSQLVAITSLALFPCIAVTAAFSHNFLLFLYGNEYITARYALMFLMAASGLAMIDQVLSQIMTARKDYRGDMDSILVGGISTAALTYLLTLYFGASGAAFALLVAMLLTVIVRLVKLKTIFPIKLLLLSIWRPAVASFIIFILSFTALKTPLMQSVASSKYLWIGVVPLVLCLYGLIVYAIGGINLAKSNRIKQFLFHEK
jgi:O-antigen/teichoic acid export membrane protein